MSAERQTTERRRSRPLRVADARGAVRLATLGVAGITDVVEDMHRAVLRTLGLRSPRGRGITALVYRSIRGITRALSGGADRILHALQPVAAQDGSDDEGASPRRLALLAALNGVLGDRLVADDNPLALTMSLHCRGRPLDARAPPDGRRLLLLIHGLCLSDRDWVPRGAGVDHGSLLAAELGYLPLHLRYNSGLRIAENGRQLAERLEALLDGWPQPVDELSVVAHSMGGLVMRSACRHAELAGHRWLQVLRKVAFLGTPHHGAPLERAGRRLQVLLGTMPYSAPLTRIGALRSAGITDLGHGRLSENEATETFPLPANVAFFTVAATTAARRGLLADRLIGDGLVPLRSALGQHHDPRRRLHFAEGACWIAYRTGHIELLGKPEVAQQLLRWFG